MVVVVLDDEDMLELECGEIVPIKVTDKLTIGLETKKSLSDEYVKKYCRCLTIRSKQNDQSREKTCSERGA